MNTTFIADLTPNCVQNRFSSFRDLLFEEMGRPLHNAFLPRTSCNECKTGFPEEMNKDCVLLSEDLHQTWQGLRQTSSLFPRVLLLLKNNPSVLTTNELFYMQCEIEYGEFLVEQEQWNVIITLFQDAGITAWRSRTDVSLHDPKHVQTRN